MDVSDLIPLAVQPALAWLGKCPKWMELKALGGDPPRTGVKISRRVIQDHLARTPSYPPAQAMTKWVLTTNAETHPGAIVGIEAYSKLLADGPKLFLPTVEQFESMENVELSLPVGQFRMPYPAMAFALPRECRVRLAETFGLDVDETPRLMGVRIYEPGVIESLTVMAWARFGREEETFLFSDQPGNPTIEDVIRRRVVNNRYVNTGSADLTDKSTAGFATVFMRACLNLSLMLTHYGHETAGPLDPHAYKKHREKKHLRHLKHNDFLAIRMKQEIVVRQKMAPTNNPAGPGTGIEMTPHWRKGHWRCYPGQAEKRAAGEKVPLLFVRPCVVRRDRVVGDVGDSEVVYRG